MYNFWRLGSILPTSVLPTRLAGLPSPSPTSDFLEEDATTLSSIEPFPILPRELVLRIFSFTLPPPTYSTSSQRYQQLLDYSLLDRDCARWASLELWRDVYLPNARSAKLFSAAIELTHRKRCSLIRVIRVGQVDVEAENMFQEDWLYVDVGKFLERLLAFCSQVQELWIAGARDLELNCLSNGRKLRKLYLFESRIVPTPDPTPSIFNLPQLQLLHLKAVICTGSTLEQLLSRSSLPSLKILDFFSVHQSLVTPTLRHAPLQHVAGQAPPNLQQLNNMFAQLQTPTPSIPAQFHQLPPYTLTPEIEHLALGPYSTRTLPLSALPFFTSLISLSIPISLFLSSSLELSHFPPSLRALRITSAMTRTDQREQERNQTDLKRRWEVALRKAIQVFKAVRNGGATEIEIERASFDEFDLSISSYMEESTLLSEDEVVSSLRVRIVEEEETLEDHSGQLAMTSRSTGSALLYDWETDDTGLSSRDGGLELGQERWRETFA